MPGEVAGDPSGTLEKTGSVGIFRRPGNIQGIEHGGNSSTRQSSGDREGTAKEVFRGRQEDHRGHRRDRGAGGRRVPCHPERRGIRVQGPRLDEECRFREGERAEEAGRGSRGGRHRRRGEPEKGVPRRPWGVLRHVLLGALFSGEGTGGGEKHGRRGETRGCAPRHLVDSRGYPGVGSPRRPPHADPHGENTRSRTSTPRARPTGSSPSAGFRRRSC